MASGTGNWGNGNGAGNGPGRPASAPVILARERVVRIGPLAIDPAGRQITRDDGREDILEPRMMQVLVALIRGQGAVVSREDLIDSCWDGRIVSDEAISSVIYRLRRALKRIAGDVVRVETIAKVGFRLICAPVQPAIVAGGEAPARAGSTSNQAVRWAGMAAVVAGVVALGLVVVPPLRASDRPPR